jgi:hypothetical protein
MNALEAEFIASVESKNESRAIEILRCGFPMTYQIRTRDAHRNLIPGYTYPLLLAVLLNLYELTRFLLASGAPLHTFDTAGQTAVLISAAVGNLPILRLLLSYKPDITVRDFAGNTMLHLASLKNQLEVVKLCIEELRFPVIVQNQKGQTAIDLARINQEQSRSLKETENIQKVIEYLWRAQEEFKRTRSKQVENFSVNAGRYKRFRMDGLAKVKIVPGEVGQSSPQAKRSVEEYLSSKHTQIFKSFTAKGESGGRISRMMTGARSVSPFLK